MQRHQTGRFLLAAALATACSPDTGQPDAAADTAMPRPWATAAAGTAALETTSGDDVFLSYVWDVTTDSRGNVYVIDGGDAAIIALQPRPGPQSPDRQGRRGPGGIRQTGPGPDPPRGQHPCVGFAVAAHHGLPSRGRRARVRSAPGHAGKGGQRVEAHRAPPDTSPAHRPPTWPTGRTKDPRGRRCCGTSTTRANVWPMKSCTNTPPASHWCSGARDS